MALEWIVKQKPVLEGWLYEQESVPTTLDCITQSMYVWSYVRMYICMHAYMSEFSLRCPPFMYEDITPTNQCKMLIG